MFSSFHSFSPNILLFCCTILLLYQQIKGVQQFKDLSGLVGDNIQLPCEVSVERCGEFHSIKWYRGSSRIFVFSDMGNKIARSEGGYVDRAQFRYKENYTTSYLELKELLVTDEAVYKCEITYLEVRENCQVVQFINLTTLIKPKYIKITKDGAPLKNETTEHMNEDDLIMLECESGGGKPIPTVEWWNGTEKMDGTLNIFPESNGIGTARHSHKIVLTRGDLSAKYECRAYNDALNYPLISWVQMDVNVRPYAMEMAKAESPSHQGQMVNLSCIVRGAKPEATVTWFNGTEVLSKTPESDVPPQRERYLGIKQTSHSHGDGTYDTVSTLQFFASRFENDVTFSCEATNPVKELKNEGSLRKEDRLEVFYPPIVMVNASNLVVNETSDILIFCTYEANPATLKSIKWLQDGRLVDINKDHYEGGTIDQTTLTIKNSTRDDNGNYSCELANQVNSSMSLNVVPISVYFKPTVRLRIHPIKPIKEIDELNATLLCDVESGNPMKLETVRWYLDGKFLKEIPDCSPNSTFCDNNLVINKLILERVTRGFIGNYSCEGKNAAGWGERSPDAELIVYYPPGAAKLEYEPSRVVKGGMVTLTCSVARNGLPSSTEFHWYRGNQLIPQEKGPVWIIHSVTLETKANFTCQAVNAGGEGLPDTKYIDVYAPPQFIKRPSHYTGVLLNSQTVNISCRVECYPLCEIEWLKNYRKMDFRMPEINERYAVEVTNNPPDLRTNDFESIESTLILKMDAWPNGQLDPTLDNVNYTCQSTSNEVGQGVKSTTQFGVEYPPDGLRVSKEIVNVIEKNMPEKIVCSAKAFPEPGYSWAKEDDPNNTLSKTNSLSLNVPISRKHAGNYICTATNRHGSNTAKTILNVMYRPECGIVQSQRDGKIVLTCSATGNPSELDFKWSVKNENETITEGVAKFGNHSDLTLESSSESFRTYLCYAINSVGTSLPCALDVTGSVSWWYALFEHDHLIILLVIIIGLIILVIIICVIIIIICRRKRTADKYNSSVELEDRQNSDILCSSPSQTNLNTSGNSNGKWPLRPGVLVHVNTNHSLLSHQSPPSSPTKSASSDGLDKRKKPSKRSTFLNSTFSAEPSQPSRAAKIKSMFGGGKYAHCDSNGTLPGVFNKSGVVTFKKLDVSIITRQSLSRKRKAPTPCPASKDKNDLSSSPNDALLQPDGDKVFYENLPFHGMQNPPNKNIQTTTVVTTSRPPSELSHYAGSSGYGSTRSQTGVTQSDLNQQVDTADGDQKFHSLKNPKKRPTADIPQFRSLRISNRNKSPSHMHSIQETTEHQKPKVEKSETRNVNDTMRKISPNCLLKSTILIKDAKKILTKDLKSNAQDNISDISGISELPDSEPNSMSSQVETKDVDENKTENGNSNEQAHNENSAGQSDMKDQANEHETRIKSPLFKTQKETSSNNLKSANKNVPMKNTRDMKLRANKSYRIIEMPKKDFEEFMAHRLNKNADKNLGICPNRITFDFINKKDPDNQLRILNCSLKNNSKSTSCLKDLEKTDLPKENLKASISSENISIEEKSKSRTDTIKSQVTTKPTIAKPARSFKNRPLGNNVSQLKANPSHALRDMILKPPDKFSKALSPSNSFNKDIAIIRELDNSLNKNTVQTKTEPIKTVSKLEKRPLSYTAVLKSPVKSMNSKGSVHNLKEKNSGSSRLIALNKNPTSMTSNNSQINKLSQNDSKLLIATRTLDDIRKDLDNMRNRPSHRLTDNKKPLPNIKTEIPKRLEPIKIVSSENKHLNASLDSNKYLKLIATPPKNEEPDTTENLQEKSERLLSANEKGNGQSEIHSSSRNETESTQSLPTTNIFKSAAFSRIEANKSDPLEPKNFVIGSCSGAFKSLSTLSLERESKHEDVYLNSCHIKPITRLKSSQSFQHRNTTDDVQTRNGQSLAKKPSRHSSLNNSFRSLRSLIRTKSSSSDKCKSEDTTKPTPAPRRLRSFSNFKSRLTDSKTDYQNIPIPIPPNNSHNIDAKVPDDTDENSKYASSRSLDRRYNGGANHYATGANHYAHHNGRTSSSTMHRNYSSSATSRQDECILQAPSYQMPAPPPYLNHNGYSDLQMTHRPLHRPVVNPPYYQDYAAVIKFHDVGKEIDV